MTAIKFADVPDDKKRIISPGLCKEMIRDVEIGYQCGCKPGVNCMYSIQNQLEEYIKGYMLDNLDFQTKYQQ